MKVMLAATCLAVAALSLGPTQAHAESKMAKKFMAGPAIGGNAMGKPMKKPMKTMPKTK